MRIEALRKCEDCGIKAEGQHPDGWVRTSRSKYGKQYDRAGIAWWCPICHVKQELEIIGLSGPVLLKIMESVRWAIGTAERQRDELLALAGQMCSLLDDLTDGYPSEIPTIEGYRNKLDAIACARSPSPVRLGQGGSGQAGEGQSTQESPRLIQWSFTVECPRCSKLFEVPHLALEVLATGAELGECAGCGCPITVSLHSHSTDERK